MKSVIAVMLLSASCLAAGDNAKAPAGFYWKSAERPSAGYGKLFRVDFRFKMQNDFRVFQPDRETEEGLYELHRARVGVEGRFLKYFEFELERELTDSGSLWKDAFVNFRYLRRLQIQAGKFKIPFGMDQLTGPLHLDFIYRSGIGSYLSPGRDIGVMAHGRFFHRGLSYEAGLFRQDGENARAKDNQAGSGITLGARVTGTPLRLAPLPSSLADLRLGAAFTASHVEEGPNGLRGRTAAKESFFDRIYVSGRRLRFGTELSWTPEPLSIKGEYIQVRDERRGQGLLGEDLPNLVSRGWYLTGGWTVLRARSQERGEAHTLVRNLWTTDGFGAVQLVARYEQLRFGASEHPGPPSRSPRAANLLGNSNRAWTFGVNWRLNLYTRIQFNLMREKIEDLQRSPVPRHPRLWGQLCRLQFSL